MFGHRKFSTLLIILNVALLMLTACGCGAKQKIDTSDGVTNIFDYVTVDFSGNNGEGTAYVNVDYNGLETEMVGGEDKIKSMDDMEDFPSLTKYINTVSSISFSIDQNEGLTNGDQVTVSVTYDESAAQSAGVVFGDEKSHTYAVKGLK